MWNSDFSETRMFKTVKEELERRLPQDWLLSLSKESRLFPSKASVDAVLEIRSPDGISATVFVEVKQKPLEVREIVSQTRLWRNAFLNRPQKSENDEDNIIVITPYLGQSARGELAKEGISFVDMTGNIRFVLRRPAVFIEAQGANKNPLRKCPTEISQGAWCRSSRERFIRLPATIWHKGVVGRDTKLSNFNLTGC